MSFAAASTAFSISLYLFLMRVLTLYCVAEASVSHNAFSALSTESSPDSSAHDCPSVRGEGSLTASVAASPRAAPTKCNMQRTNSTVSASLTTAESTVRTSPTATPTEATKTSRGEQTTGEGSVGTQKNPPQARRAAPASHAELHVENHLRRQSPFPPAATSSAEVLDRVPAAAARSAAVVEAITRNTPQATIRAASPANAAGRAGVGHPPGMANAVISTGDATGLPVGMTEGTSAAAALAAPAVTTMGAVSGDAALDAASATLSAATARLTEGTAVAQVPGTSLALIPDVAAIGVPAPALAASAAVAQGKVRETDPPPRILKGQENAVCRLVAVEAQSVCKKVKPAQRTYSCMKQVVEKICEEVPFVIQKMCTKTFHERKPFKCDRVEYKSECIQKRETTKTECVQTIIKEDAYPCPKVDYVTKCNKKPVLTPSVCKHEIQKEFQYPCEKTVKEEQCAEVEKEVDQVCEEDVVVPEKYDCSKTIYVKKCSPAAGKAATGIRAAGGAIPAAVSDRMDELPSEGGDEKAPRRLRKVVATPDAVVVPLPKTQISVEMCVDVPQLKRKTCTREVVKKERRPCKGVKKEIQCNHVTKVIQEICSTMKKVVEPYACTKTEMQQECSTVAQQVEDTCTRQVPVDEKGPCEIEIFKNECVPVPVRIPDVCFETRPKTEVYDCSENSSKSVCKEELKEVEQQCVETEFREIEYACTQLEHVERCVIPDSAPSVVATPLPPHKYGRKQHERARVLPLSEVVEDVYDEEEVEQTGQVEHLSTQAPPPMTEPQMKKDYVTVMMGPSVKKTKMKWREKLHKLGDPDLGEKKDGEKVQESKAKTEDGDRSPREE